MSKGLDQLGNYLHPNGRIDVYVRNIKYGRITQLECSSLRFKDLEIGQMAKELKDNKSVVRLFLRGNEMGDEGIEGISEVLEKNTPLKWVDLGYNKHVTEKGGSILAEGIKKNTILEKLALNGCKVGDAFAISVAETLKENTTLRSLFIPDIGMTDEGLIALGKGIRLNTSLQKLNVSMNEFGEEGMESFAKDLSVNVERRAGLEELFVGRQFTNMVSPMVIHNKIKREWMPRRHEQYPLFFHDQVFTLLLMWNHDEYEDDECDTGIEWNYHPLEVVLRIVKWLALFDVPYDDDEWKKVKNGEEVEPKKKKKQKKDKERQRVVRKSVFSDTGMEKKTMEGFGGGPWKGRRRQQNKK